MRETLVAVSRIRLRGPRTFPLEALAARNGDPIGIGSKLRNTIITYFFINVKCFVGAAVVQGKYLVALSNLMSNCEFQNFERKSGKTRRAIGIPRQVFRILQPKFWNSSRQAKNLVLFVR